MHYDDTERRSIHTICSVHYLEQDGVLDFTTVEYSLQQPSQKNAASKSYDSPFTTIYCVIATSDIIVARVLIHISKLSVLFRGKTRFEFHHS